MRKAEYTIPKNKCQCCYQTTGRYILDCYCILCPECFALRRIDTPHCQLCTRTSKGNYIDANLEGSLKTISHLFGSAELHLSNSIEICKFQQNIANRYCRYLETELSKYKEAIKELVANNPQLSDYFTFKLQKTSSNNIQQRQTSSVYTRASKANVLLTSHSEDRHEQRNKNQYDNHYQTDNGKQDAVQRLANSNIIDHKHHQQQVDNRYQQQQQQQQQQVDNRYQQQEQIDNRYQQQVDNRYQKQQPPQQQHDNRPKHNDPRFAQPDSTYHQSHPETYVYDSDIRPSNHIETKLLPNHGSIHRIPRTEEHKFSGRIYQVPNINHITALRSSKRPPRHDNDAVSISHYKRK